MPDKVMIFIDGHNLYKSCETTFGLQIGAAEIEKLSKRLLGHRELVRIYYYDARPDRTRQPALHQRKQRFFAQLQRISDLEFRPGRLVYPDNWPHCKPRQKGVDAMLIVDVFKHAYRGDFDTAILVSNDGDFAEALQEVKAWGKHVEAVLFGGSQQLRKAADVVIAMRRDFLV